ncbi:hypothetical protein LEMLEM_LOCUS22179 [Lemmus lemmus]
MHRVLEVLSLEEEGFFASGPTCRLTTGRMSSFPHKKKRKKERKVVII